MMPFHKRRPLQEAAYLSDLVFKVFANLHKRYRNVRNAREQVVRLRMELDSLGDALHEMGQNFLKYSDRTFSDKLWTECEAIGVLLKHLYVATRDSWSDPSQPISWPFSMDEQEDILWKIKQFKEYAVRGSKPMYFPWNF